MDITLTFAVIVAVIVGVVAAFRKAGLPTRWAPLASLALGVLAISWLQAGLSGEGAILGLIAGLSASGLWSGAKTTFT